MSNKDSLVRVGVQQSWSFGNGNADDVKIVRQVARAIFNEHGFDGDALIPEIDENDALRRAAKYAPTNKFWKIAEFARSNGRDRSYGIYYRTGENGERGDQWTCGARVRYDASIGEIAALPPEGLGTFPNLRCKDVADRMAKFGNSVMKYVVNADLSAALVGAGSSLGWISRRRLAGGVYFLPINNEVDELRAERFISLLRALESYTADRKRANRFYPQIDDQFSTPNTMATWRDSAEDQFEAEFERLMEDLSTMVTTGTMREKTKQARADEVDALIEKAERYRLFMGSAVDKLTDRLTAVQSGFEASLRADEEALMKAFADIEALGESLTEVHVDDIDPPKGRELAFKAVLGAPAEEKDELFDVFGE